MRFRFCAGIVALAAISGCAAPDGGSAGFSPARFENAEWRTVFQAAEATMREFFRVGDADERTGCIRSVPTAITTEHPAGRLGKPISSPSPMRQLAEIRVEPEGRTIVARCRVIVQRLESTSRMTYASQRTIDDTPNQTPLMESEGLEQYGGGVWTAAGQDHKLEMDILAAIRERVARTTNAP